MAGPYNPPIRGAEYVVFVSLQSMAQQGTFRAAPTLAAGDFKVSKDGGALANLETLPTNEPAGSIWVKVTLSASEMDADNVAVQAVDQTAAKEWADTAFCVQTI